jgi:hypothetical protein
VLTKCISISIPTNCTDTSGTKTSLAVNSTLINFASGRLPTIGSPLTDFYLVPITLVLLPFTALARLNISQLVRRPSGSLVAGSRRWCCSG